jgi:hypothetical protein
MFGRTRALYCAALCVLLLGPVPAFGSDASGVFHPTCDIIYGYQLELMRYAGHHLEEPIRFKIFGDMGLQMFPNKWLDEQGMECRDADPCAGYFSRLQVLHVSYHRGHILGLSGKVTIVLGGGRKLEGSFTAKYVKPAQPLICE